MPDERLDSMAHGVGAPPESPEAQEADRRRRAELARDPGPEMEGAMGGSSDADTAGDEADMDAGIHRGLADDQARAGDGSGRDEA